MRVRRVPAIDNMANAIAAEARDQDVVITMGAGSIGAVAQQVIQLIRGPA